jgi:hypothetical protein
VLDSLTPAGALATAARDPRDLNFTDQVRSPFLAARCCAAGRHVLRQRMLFVAIRTKVAVRELEQNYNLAVNGSLVKSALAHSLYKFDTHRCPALRYFWYSHKRFK